MADFVKVIDIGYPSHFSTVYYYFGRVFVNKPMRITCMRF